MILTMDPKYRKYLMNIFKSNFNLHSSDVAQGYFQQGENWTTSCIQRVLKKLQNISFSFKIGILLISLCQHRRQRPPKKQRIIIKSIYTQSSNFNWIEKNYILLIISQMATPEVFGKSQCIIGTVIFQSKLNLETLAY